MALYRCGGGGSSELQETVLWTNSAPTSSFAMQAVTLSDDINNYDYIKFYYRISTTNTTTAAAMYKVTEYKLMLGDPGARGMIGSYLSSVLYARNTVYTSDTSITFGEAQAKGATTKNNAYLVPTAICGLKGGVAPKPSGTETVLWTNESPTAAFATQTVTLSDSLSNYRYMKMKFKGIKSNTTEGIAIWPIETVQASVSGGSYAARCMIAGNNQAGNGCYVRPVNYASPTSITFPPAYAMNNSGNNSDYAIPTEIIGIS